MANRIFIGITISSLFFFTFCRKDKPIIPVLTPVIGEQYPGGKQSSFNQSENAFGQVAPGLTGTNANYFYTGNSLFNQNWVSAPASATARDGLGPTLNGKSCSACHFKDGRGHAPNFFDQLATGFLVRLSVPGTDAHGGPVGDPNYGGQLNDQAILGVDREGQVNISYTEIQGQYADGTTYSLRKPEYTFPVLNFGAMAGDVMISPRIGQQMIGLGLLEAINESDLLLISDEHDADGDGISGRPNMVWDVLANTTTMGRFGWKANQPNIKQQVAGAFQGDLGITSSLFSNENCPGPQSDCYNAPNGGAPEIDDENLDKVVLYSSNLAVPTRPDFADQSVLAGKKLFNEMNCAKCHVASFTTGIHSEFPHLSKQKIWPYTDLLLHDMGSGLADNRPDYQANGNEWRTSPLWGIGLIPTVNGHTNYLHDGRARNLEEAILWHGGEAENSKQAFINLNKAERALVIKFLNSL